MGYTQNIDRDGFKDKLQEYLGGALREFYKARLASKNGETQWVLHWIREAYDLADRAAEVFTDYEIRGFKDKLRACREVMDHLDKRDRSYRTRATNAVRRDFRGTRLAKRLDDRDTSEFWLMISKALKI